VLPDELVNQSTGDIAMNWDVRARKMPPLFTLSVSMALALGLLPGLPCSAQTKAQPGTIDSELLSAVEGARDGGVRNNSAAKAETPAPAPDPEISPAVARQLAAMQAQIDELRAELRSRAAGEAASMKVAEAPSPKPPEASPKPAITNPEMKPAESAAVVAPAPVAPAAATVKVDNPQARSGLPQKPTPSAPFAYADWTWLNGNPRNKDAVWDSKFFTPEVRIDTH